MSIATSFQSYQDLLTIKHNDAFATYDPNGDIDHKEKEVFCGLFIRDMRHLSKWQIRFDNAPFSHLKAQPLQSHGVVMTHHLRNDAFQTEDGVDIIDQSIHMLRQKILYNETIYERIEINNHSAETITLRFGFDFEVDFCDFFVARQKFKYRKTGRIKRPKIDDKCISFIYNGLDKIDRETHIAFSHQPHQLKHNSVSFNVTIKPQAQQVLVVSIGNRKRVSSTDFFHALDKKREEHQNSMNKWIDIETSSGRMNTWLNNSKNALVRLSTLKDTGIFPYAGLPRFNAAFGRDSLIVGLQTLWLNDEFSKGILNYLSKTQATEIDVEADAQPGKIIHEVRHSEMCNIGEVPFKRYYGTVDSTPLFVMLASAYHEKTHDKETISAIWENIKAALSWIVEYGDIDGDGFIEYHKTGKGGHKNHGWKDNPMALFHEDGSLAESPIALCEVQGYAYAAYMGGAYLAHVMDEPDYAKQWEKRAEDLYKNFNKVFWDKELGGYVLALDKNKKPCRVRTSNMGHILYCGLAPEDRAETVVRTLMHDDMFSGWGIRTASTREKLYNPISYHNGSVWPHDVSLIAAGMAKYGFYDQASTLLVTTFDAAQKFEHMILPELFCGYERSETDPLVQVPVSCIPQAWSCGAPFLLLQAALGINYNPETETYETLNPKFPHFFQWLEMRSAQNDETILYKTSE